MWWCKSASPSRSTTELGRACKGLGVVVVAVFSWALAATSLGAQGPDAAWRTLATDRFRLHYPAEYEAWARHAGSRLEAVAEAVDRAVGFSPKGPVDVLVLDPQASANGSAYAILDAPRVVLWTTPPSPLSTLGSFLDPVEQLLVHEQVHLAHLLRPSRHPWRSALERLLPMGPIAARAPRWVTEGYATQLEGELTGAGRPQGEIRSAVLRRWAQLGRLSPYGALSGDSERWLGTSMPYLVGSAYLEWLRDRAGDDSLRDLWARLSARRSRSFEEAFRGVFGDDPQLLYGRFRAEMSAAAIALEEPREIRDGELWQRLSWTTGTPALSANGERLAVVLRDRRRPARLVVWKTGPQEEALRKRAEAVARMLAEDSEDVASVASDPPAREPLFELRTGDRLGPLSPRWIGDEALLFSRLVPDLGGQLHADLYLWTPATDRLRRLTRGGDLREADPAPDGTWAVATRHRHGLSELVRVDLESGEARSLTEPSVVDVVAHPRLDPSGRRVAYVRHREGRWSLFWSTLDDGSPKRIPLPEDASLVAHPEWQDEGRLRVVLGRRGSLEIYEVELEGEGPARRLTSSHGGSLGFASDRRTDDLYFLTLEPHGLDLRKLEAAASAQLPEVPDLALARPPTALRGKGFASRELGEDRAYGLGRQEGQALLGLRWASSSESVEIGARLGDVVGRVNAVALASLGGQGSLRGGAIASSLAIFPWRLAAHVFAYEERPSRQDSLLAVGEELDAEARGLEIATERRFRTARTDLDVEIGTTWSRVERAADSSSFDDSMIWARAGWRGRFSRDTLTLGWAVEGLGGAGRTGGESWWAQGLLLEGRAEWKSLQIDLSGRSQGIDDSGAGLVVGGLPSSVLPGSSILRRIVADALPRGVLRGDRYDQGRAEVGLGSFPVSLFFETHRVRAEDGGRSDWLEVAGLELALSSDAAPLFRLPAVGLGLGFGRILAGSPSELGDWRFWASLSYRP